MREMRTAAVALLCGVALTLVSASCGSSSAEETTRVPSLDTTTLGVALTRLEASNLRVALSGFGPLPAGYGLDDAPVGDQEPEPGSQVDANAVVRLNMHAPAPIPTPALPSNQPHFSVIPDFVGKSWPRVARLLSPRFTIEIGHVPDLSTRAARDVLASYVVKAQEPAAGTRVISAGTRTNSGYANPIVRLKITVRRADR
jgi:hypothetical protein